ncbi:archaellin/type IV pilin N-terminal domain-containing protein [Nanoarchaeota archaeon]
MKNKKGVSPLIATVLLIAFAVALGAVVMNWGRGYVEDTANTARERSDTEVKCASDVDIAVVDIDGTPQICYNISGTTDYMEMIVENRKSTTVESLTVRMIGTSTRVPETYNLGDSSNLTANKAKFFNVSYDAGTLGDIQQVKITPTIKVAGQDVICAQNAEIVNNLKPCSEIYT